MFENFLKDVFDDFSEAMDNIKNQMQETKKLKSYRKIRSKKKFKRKHMRKIVISNKKINKDTSFILNIISQMSGIAERRK